MDDDSGRLTVIVGLVLLILACLLVGAFYARNVFSPEGRAINDALHPDYVLGRRIIWYALVIFLSIALAGGGLGILAWGLRKLRDILLIEPTHALYPAMLMFGYHPAQNEPGAQRVAALTNNQHEQPLRLAAGTVKAAINPRTPDDALLPAPESPPAISAEAAIEVDPKRYPHTILIGETGAGKSRATFLLLSMLTRRYPCEVLILEREAIDWNTASAVRTPAGYLAALRKVEAERQRRADMLRAADVQYITDLPNPPPYLVVVVEEAESVYSDFSLTDRNMAKEYAVIMRNLAQLGRKEGVVFVVTTQTGTSSVFDIPTRKQFGTRLFFRSEPQVGDSWGIPRNFRLAELPTGTAYSMRHNGLVTFPLLARPTLPLSNLYRENVLQLPADAEADGLGPDDLPSTGGWAPVATATTGLQGGNMPVATVVGRIEEGRYPTSAEAAQMRVHYAHTGSKTATCKRFYGYKDGVVWGFVEDALQGRV